MVDYPELEEIREGHGVQLSCGIQANPEGSGRSFALVIWGAGVPWLPKIRVSGVFWGQERGEVTPGRKFCQLGRENLGKSLNQVRGGRSAQVWEEQDALERSGLGSLMAGGARLWFVGWEGRNAAAGRCPRG